LVPGESGATEVLVLSYEKDLSWLPGLNYDRVPMNRKSLTWLVMMAYLPLGFGCAAQSDSNSKQLRELTEQVRGLQATTDRLQERLSALENSRTKERGPAVVTTPPMDTPNLPVVRMGAETVLPSVEASAVSNSSEEPRPLIVGEGSRIETRTSGSEASVLPPSPRRGKDTKRSSGATDPGKTSP
jgi:hypothetical protein